MGKGLFNTQIWALFLYTSNLALTILIKVSLVSIVVVYALL